MGCGHSKINIYPRRAKSKTNGKKSATPEKTAESEEEDGVENDTENSGENLDESCDSKKTTIKVKPFGGPLLAQTEISSSQQDFFKMLDEKIQNGPDYNSESETERAAEAARLNALLKDWETASAGSRSLPATPKRRLKPPPDKGAIRSAEAVRTSDRGYPSQIPQSVIHQSYGVTAVSYRQVNFPAAPAYISQSPSHAHIAYPSALQYQAISPMYTQQPVRQYPTYGSPVKSYGNSPKHIPYDPSTYTSPTHKLYTAGPKPVYSNGEIQFYNQMQYQQAREQVIAQNQHQPAFRRNYQSSVTIPIAVQNQNEISSHRKQYELT